MKRSVIFVALLGLFAVSFVVTATPSHKPHKVKKHKAVKHRA